MLSGICYIVLVCENASTLEVCLSPRWRQLILLRIHHPICNFPDFCPHIHVGPFPSITDRGPFVWSSVYSDLTSVFLTSRCLWLHLDSHWSGTTELAYRPPLIERYAIHLSCPHIRVGPSPSITDRGPFVWSSVYSDLTSVFLASRCLWLRLAPLMSHNSTLNFAIHFRRLTAPPCRLVLPCFRGAD